LQVITIRLTNIYPKKIYFNKRITLIKHLQPGILFILLALLNYNAICQISLRGTITNDAGELMPFATVYEDGTTNGTTSNAHGIYQLLLTPGRHQIVVQHVGYARQTKEIIVTEKESNQLDFKLQPETLVLKEVVVSANEQDQARVIIRNAIRKRKYYRDEVAAYTCEVYVKGLQRLDKKPSSLLGATITVDTGIVYLSESISKLKYLHPDQINETIISSKVSGNSNGFSYNQASEMMINLYENSYFVEGLSERPLISPIASNAFLYYDYKMAGTLVEDSLFIHKIRLIPKRKTDPVFSGYIYIIENSWRIHSVDVSLYRSNGIEFLDSLHVNQVFAPVGYNIWMPISQRFTFKFNAFGFEGSGHFTGIYKNYKVQPNYWFPTPQKTTTSKKSKSNNAAKPTNKKTAIKDADKDPLLTKKDFSNALVTVEEDANEKDSMYWASVRPIPLTRVEIKDYAIKDSIRIIKESKPYNDSIDHHRNKLKLGNLFFSHYTHFNSFDKRYLTFPNLRDGIQYNTVEGVVANMQFHWQQRDKIGMRYRISPAIRYGFSNHRLQARIEGAYRLNPKAREYIFGGFGRYVYQFNEQQPIGPLANSFFTLVHGKNYGRFYQKAYFTAGYQKELINGLTLKTRVAYENRQQMNNVTTYNFAGNQLSPNVIQNAEIGAATFPTHQALLLVLDLNMKFDQKYIDRPDRKITLPSKYPELSIYYKKGIPALGSDINYDLLRIGTKYNKRFGQLGESQISGFAGAFINSKKMYIQDFQHFNGNHVYVRKMNGENLFMLLNYYTYSTKSRFLELHYEHHFNEFIFNKIPLIRRLNLQAVGSLNYLSTPAAGQYIELGGGIEHIFKFLRLDYYSSFQNGHHQMSGLRAGLGF